MSESPDSFAPRRDRDLTEQSIDHAKVYAARMRLQNALDQADALEGVREIVANLVGSEELALFKLDADHAAFWLYWSFGIDPNALVVLDTFEEPNLAYVLNGQAVLSDGEEKILACNRQAMALIPIIIEGAARAVLVIFRLFPHKSGFDGTDREICKVLMHCAGKAVEYRAS